MSYTDADLRKLIESRTTGYTLPAPLYLSQEVFERDIDLIFGRHWIYIGVEPEIPEPGDFFTVYESHGDPAQCIADSTFPAQGPDCAGRLIRVIMRLSAPFAPWSAKRSFTIN